MERVLSHSGTACPTSSRSLWCTAQRQVLIMHNRTRVSRSNCFWTLLVLVPW
ncbi:hypothetical protein BS78_02G231200 [Paspalum vaginatum]|nr:hypothetical protein BS78_02G231200 [Paspalum vaginatum]